MKKDDLLFVYGSLRIGECNDIERKSPIGSVEYKGQDKINGLIYWIGAGWYPGLKTEQGNYDSRAPKVVGDVFEIKTDEVAAMLDAYEGYPSLYDRVEVETEGGRIVWVYTYNGGVKEYELVESGDWTKRPRVCVTRVPAVPQS